MNQNKSTNEPQETVYKKGQIATKVLADTIGRQFSQLLQKNTPNGSHNEQQLQDQQTNINDLNRGTDQLLKNLAEVIASKYKTVVTTKPNAESEKVILYNRSIKEIANSNNENPQSSTVILNVDEYGNEGQNNGQNSLSDLQYNRPNQSQFLPPPQKNQQARFLPPPTRTNQAQFLPPPTRTNQSQFLPPPTKTNQAQFLPPPTKSSIAQFLPPPQRNSVMNQDYQQRSFSQMLSSRSTHVITHNENLNGDRNSFVRSNQLISHSPNQVRNSKYYAENEQGSSQSLTQEKRVVSERRGNQIVRTNITENMSGVPTSNRQMTDVNITQQKEQFNRNVVERNFEVITERPIVREVIVEKPYDVIIEKPIENKIYRDVIIEKFIENPIERVIEQNVEKIVRKNVEVIVNKPVYVEEFVDKVIPNRIENKYEVLKEMIVNESVPVDVHVNRTILKPIRNEVQTKEVIKDVPVYQDVYVDRPYEKVIRREVEQPYDVYIDRDVFIEVPKEIKEDVIVERRVERPVQRIVDVPETKQVKKSIRVDRYIDKEIEVVKKVDKPIKKTVDRIVEKQVFVDKIVELDNPIYKDMPYYVDKKIEVKKTIERPREIIRDKYVDVEVEQIIEVPMYVEKQVEVVVEKKVTKYVEQLNENFKDIDVVTNVVIPVERIIEKKVRRDKIVPKTIEREQIIEVPVDIYIDKEIEIERVVQKPVYVERIVEKLVDKEVIRRVEVIKEKYVEVPREVYRDKIIELYTTVDKPIYVEKSTEMHNHVLTDDKNIRLKNDIEETKVKLLEMQNEYAYLCDQIAYVKKTQSNRTINEEFEEGRIGDEDNYYLRLELNKLHDEYNEIVEEQNRLYVEQFNQANKKIGFGKSIVVTPERKNQPQFQDTSNYVPNRSIIQVVPDKTKIHSDRNNGVAYNEDEDTVILLDDSISSEQVNAPLSKPKTDNVQRDYRPTLRESKIQQNGIVYSSQLQSNFNQSFEVNNFQMSVSKEPRIGESRVASRSPNRVVQSSHVVYSKVTPSFTQNDSRIVYGQDINNSQVLQSIPNRSYYNVAPSTQYKNIGTQRISQETQRISQKSEEQRSSYTRTDYNQDYTQISNPLYQPDQQRVSYGQNIQKSSLSSQLNPILEHVVSENNISISYH